jgi:hypothetical protein
MFIGIAPVLAAALTRNSATAAAWLTRPLPSVPPGGVAALDDVTGVVAGAADAGAVGPVPDAGLEVSTVHADSAHATLATIIIGRNARMRA